MRRVLVTSLGLALLAAPAVTAAPPSGTDKTNAARECRSERGDSAATREAFRAKYGTNANGRNAFGKCVSRRSRSEQAQRTSAAANAVKECKAEQAADPAAFEQKYGSGKNGKNAYGKCVSSKASAKKAAADARDAQKIKDTKSAAKSCAAERKSIGKDAFAQKYGTNKNKRNAFGRCVSKTAKAKSGS